VVVIPEEPGALVQPVVVLGFVACSEGIQDLVVEEAEPVRAVWCPPVEGAAVADPGDEAAMKVDRGAVEAQIRSEDCLVVRNDVLGNSRPGQFVPKRELNRLAFLTDDDSAEVLL
jgi:hypothetical protein